jgi:hypothetical protein
MAQRYLAGNDNTNIHESRKIFMNTHAHRLTRHDPEGRIVQRNWEDERFCSELAADPAGAYSNYLQASADGPPKIVVREKTAGTPHIVLPARAASAAALSDADLERVAGGGTPLLATAVGASVFLGTTVSTYVSATVTIEVGW